MGYYFALILFIGAEVNAFFAERVHETPQDLTSMVHTMTSHLPTSEEAVQEQASATHKGEVPKEIRPKGEQRRSTMENAGSTSPSTATTGQLQAAETRPDQEEQQPDSGQPQAQAPVLPCPGPEERQGDHWEAEVLGVQLEAVGSPIRPRPRRAPTHEVLEEEFRDVHPGNAVGRCPGEPPLDAHGAS